MHANNGWPTGRLLLIIGFILNMFAITAVHARPQEKKQALAVIDCKDSMSTCDKFLKKQVNVCAICAYKKADGEWSYRQENHCGLSNPYCPSLDPAKASEAIDDADNHKPPLCFISQTYQCPKGPAPPQQENKCNTFLNQLPLNKYACCMRESERVCKKLCLPGYIADQKDPKPDVVYDCNPGPIDLCRDGKKLCGVNKLEPEVVCCKVDQSCKVTSEKILCGQETPTPPRCPPGQTLLADGVNPPRCSAQICDPLGGTSVGTSTYYYDGTCYLCTTKQSFDPETRTCVDNTCKLEGDEVLGEKCGMVCCPYSVGFCDHESAKCIKTPTIQS